MIVQKTLPSTAVEMIQTTVTETIPTTEHNIFRTKHQL